MGEEKVEKLIPCEGCNGMAYTRVILLGHDHKEHAFCVACICKVLQQALFMGRTSP